MVLFLCFSKCPADAASRRVCDQYKWKIKVSRHTLQGAYSDEQTKSGNWVGSTEHIQSPKDFLGHKPDSWKTDQCSVKWDLLSQIKLSHRLMSLRHVVVKRINSLHRLNQLDVLQRSVRHKTSLFCFIYFFFLALLFKKKINLFILIGG